MAIDRDSARHLHCRKISGKVLRCTKVCALEGSTLYVRVCETDNIVLSGLLFREGQQGDELAGV